MNSTFGHRTGVAIMALLGLLSVIGLVGIGQDGAPPASFTILCAVLGAVTLLAALPKYNRTAAGIWTMIGAQAMTGLTGSRSSGPTTPPAGRSLPWWPPGWSRSSPWFCWCPRCALSASRSRWEWHAMSRLAPDVASSSRSQLRSIGLTGLVGTGLLFASVIAGCPGRTAARCGHCRGGSLREGPDASWVPAVEAVGDIAMMVILGFMVGFSLFLRRYERAFPVRSTMAMLSGTLFAAYVVLDPAEEAATHRLADLDQGQLAFAYNVTTIGFTNVWLAMGGFAFACGWVIVSTRAMPTWLGWWGLVAGTALGLAQLVWTVEPAWLVPYAAFWLWLLTTCVLLVRGRTISQAESLAEIESYVPKP